MWVSTAQGVGIIYGFPAWSGDAGASAAPVEVHIVDGAGNTSTIVVLPAAQITQASHDMIPASRRPEEAASRAFGYL